MNSRFLLFSVLLFSFVLQPVFADTLYSFSLDTDPGWAREAAWAYGVPTGNGTWPGDPVSGYTGVKVFGYNLDGDYSNNMTEAFLTAGPLNFTGYQGIHLEFRRRLGVHENRAGGGRDEARIQASRDGINWGDVWVHEGFENTDAGWVLCKYDISEFVDNSSSAYVRWAMGPTDGQTTLPGWNIDDIVFSGEGIDALQVSPGSSQQFQAVAGFGESFRTEVFTLLNTGQQSLNWSVTSDAPWLAPELTQGSLNPGGDVRVRVILDTSSLAPGQHSAQVTFQNVATGIKRVRRLDLQLQDCAPFPFVENFDSDKLLPCWLITGTEEARARLTSDGNPRGGGGKHLLLDDISGNTVYSRNEVTLCVDLANQLNVQLSFWAKEAERSDENNGPPAMPFYGGDDFDGVAVSADGVAWYEVASLRNLETTYTRIVVDLDEAIAGFNIDYTPHFFIRWNQYDNWPWDRDGIAIDDVEIQSLGPAPELTVVKPNGGERWRRRETVSIQWESVNLADSMVTIQLTKDGAHKAALAVSTENDGEFTWTIPEDMEIGSHYGVTIKSLPDGFPRDDSDNNFEILSGPTTPAITLSPANPDTTDNLVCDIVKASIVDPNRSAAYTYAWTSNLGKEILHGPKSDLQDTLAASNTEVAESWTCTVRASDGVEESDPATAQVFIGSKQPVSISLSADPSDLRIGQLLILTAQVEPAFSTDKLVLFELTAPDGETREVYATERQNAGSTFVARTYPWQVSQTKSDWRVKAVTLESEEFLPSESGEVSFTVAATQPSLRLELSRNAVPMDYDNLSVQVSLSAPLPEELNHLLAGKTVEIHALGPGTELPVTITLSTDMSGQSIVTPQRLASAGVVFDYPGIWQFIVVSRGDATLLPARSGNLDAPSATRLTVRGVQGYAILAVGKLDHLGEGTRSHAKTMDNAYRVFRNRGFGHNQLHYMRETLDGVPSDIVVDNTAPSQQALQEAIENWAYSAIAQVPGPLYIVLAGHGSANKFYLYSGQFDETQSVTAEELGKYLDTLENKLAAPNKKASSPLDTVVLYGACHSGSFISPALSKANRIIISSCGAEQKSVRGTADPSDPNSVRDGEPFLTEFLRIAGQGRSLKESFEAASTLIVEYTSNAANDQGAATIQTPYLDDNGDGVGSSGALSVVPGLDGIRAQEHVLGVVGDEAMPVEWLEVTPSQIVGQNHLVPTLRAIADNYDREKEYEAWIEIKRPSSASAAADPAYAEFQQILNLSRAVYTPAASDLANGVFRWEGLDSFFTEAGVYKIYYYISQKGSTVISPFALTTVYKTAPNNNPPDLVSLLLPVDVSVTSSNVIFSWTAASDPDDDAVTYRLEICRDSNFLALDLVFDRLEGTFKDVSVADGLVDGVYFWRVISVDSYGAFSIPQVSRTFTVDNPNAPGVGAIVGAVVVAGSQLAVSGAEVHLVEENRTTQTDSRGLFFFSGVIPQSNRLTLTASATNFDSANYSVPVTEGQISRAEIRLTSKSPILDVQPSPLYVNNDGGSPQLQVRNLSGGLVLWSARLEGNAPWLQVQTASGQAPSTLSLHVDVNTTGLERCGKIVVEASGALNSPLTVQVIQGAECETPASPAGVQASSDQSGLVHIAWDADPALEYRVFRNDTSVFAQAQAVSGWLSTGSYDDRTAESPQAATSPCGGPPSLQPVEYWYWVVAKNSCEESSPSVPVKGAAAAKTASPDVYEEALPGYAAADNVRIVESPKSLYIRLHAESALATETIWGEVAVDSQISRKVTWLPLTADNSDGWVKWSPEHNLTQGQMVYFRGGARTSSGENVEACATLFVVKGRDVSVDDQAGVAERTGLLELLNKSVTGQVLSVQVDALGELPPSSIGPVLVVGPDTVFDEPTQVWLPIPTEAKYADLQLCYYMRQQNRWISASEVNGWLVSQTIDYQHSDEGEFAGIWVRNGAVLQWTIPSERVSERSVNGNAGIMILLTLVLGYSSKFARQRKRYKQQ